MKCDYCKKPSTINADFIGVDRTYIIRSCNDCLQQAVGTQSLCACLDRMTAATQRLERNWPDKDVLDYGYYYESDQDYSGIAFVIFFCVVILGLLWLLITI